MLPTRRLMLAAAGGLAALTLAACDRAGAASADAIALGEADAPVTVLEYASVTCSHCADFNRDVFPAFKAKYIDTGRVRYELREMLTPPETVASAGFLTARCAGNDKYYAVVDQIFQAQGAMFEGGGANVRPTLLRIAQGAGLSEAEFNACVNDDDALSALQSRVEAATRADIQFTPTFVINGRKMDGAPTLANLDAAIAAARPAAGG